MTSVLYPLLAVAIGGAGLVTVLGLRLADQRRADDDRRTIAVRFPRGLAADQVEALLRVVVGLGRARHGLAAQPAVTFDLVGTRLAISHRLRLPRTASTNLFAQLRAAVPGIAIEDVEDASLGPFTLAAELRRTSYGGDFNTDDAGNVSRTILAAVTALGRNETVVWQVSCVGGISDRPTPATLWQRLNGKVPTPPRRTEDGGVNLALRIGVVAQPPERAHELLSRLRRAASSVSAPKARLVPRWLPRRLVARRLQHGSTPVTAAPLWLRMQDPVALLGWPIDNPLIEGLSIGTSPQLPAAPVVPAHGRVLGKASVGGRPVAQPVKAAAEHMLIIGPTGVGKSVLSARLFLDDVTAGRGALLVDPKGSTADLVLERLPDHAIGRTIVVDPLDAERPVPLPLLAHESSGIPELAADNLVTLLRHRYRDLGPRSTDVLSSSLYALSRLPNATLMDVLRLWTDAAFRSHVAGLVQGDPALAAFFAWFEALTPSERSWVLAPASNKLRPLLQRAVVRNVLAAPRTTFTLAEAMRDRLVVIVRLPEGELGAEAVSLTGQVLLSRTWTAIQGRRTRMPFYVTVDEAPRFVDIGTDLGDVLARSREYAVAVTLIAQTLGQFSPNLRDVTLNSARSKIVFGTSAADAARLAAEFGPGVQADFLRGLGRYEAIGAVSLAGTVSPPFTFTTRALDDRLPGRARAVRQASRERWGVPREEIEAAFSPKPNTDNPTAGAIGRRPK